MPIYDMKCPECGHAWEVLSRTSVKCPECGRGGSFNELRQWTSPPYIRYLGKDFYATEWGKQKWNWLKDVDSKIQAYDDDDEPALEED